MPDDIVRKPALAECKTCKNFKWNFPFGASGTDMGGVVQHFHYVIMCVVVGSGLGPIACCFLGHASLLG